METCRKGSAKMHNRISVSLLLFASCISTVEAEPVEVKVPQQKMLSSPGGRFVFGQISDFRRDQYMLDTQTGRLWQSAMSKPKNPDGSEASGDGFMILQPVPYSDLDGKMGVTPK